MKVHAYCMSLRRLTDMPRADLPMVQPWRPEPQQEPRLLLCVLGDLRLPLYWGLMFQARASGTRSQRAFLRQGILFQFMGTTGLVWEGMRFILNMFNSHPRLKFCLESTKPAARIAKFPAIHEALHQMLGQKDL